MRTWIRNKLAKHENLFTFLWYLHLVKNENPEQVPEPELTKRTAVWDGKDLAAIQTATWLLPRIHGRPAAEVDPQWNLTINGMPMRISDRIVVVRTGDVTVYRLINWFERLSENDN